MYNLLIFHHYNSPLGAGLSLLHILEKIDKRQVKVTVCLPRIEGELDFKIKKMGIKVIYSDSITAYMHFSGGETPFVSRRHLQNLSAVHSSRKGIANVIEKENPDIVAVNSMTLFWIGRIAQSLNKKVICFHRETYCKGLFGMRTFMMKKELSNCFDVVAFLSNYDLEQTPLGRAKFVKITDKVDVKTYEQLDLCQCRTELELPQDCKLILYVGGCAKLKGPMTIIKAMSLLRTSNTKLVFLQYQEPNLQKISAKIKYNLKRMLGRNLQYMIAHYVEMKNMQDKVIFRPATDKVEKYFVACDVVAFPSHAPHQARPVYEAGIAKKPIIITDFTNTREFVDESCGWLFKKDDFKMLAKCIDDALNVSDSNRVVANYERVLKNNNLITLGRELYDVLGSIVEKKSEE